MPVFSDVPIPPCPAFWLLSTVAAHMAHWAQLCSGAANKAKASRLKTRVENCTFIFIYYNNTESAVVVAFVPNAVVLLSKLRSACNSCA